MRKTYKIGEVANILGVSADTIRYYEKAGIVYSKKDPSNGYRYFTPADIYALLDVLFYRSMDIPVEEVRNIMNFYQLRDVKKLLEIKMKRILKFSSEEADHYIRSLNEEIAVVKHNIEHIIPYSIAYYERIKAKYGKGRERKTEIRNFDNIEAAKVVIAYE